MKPKDVSPQSIVWGHVIDIYTVPALLIAKYLKEGTTEEFKRMNLASNPEAVPDASVVIDGVKYRVALVSSSIVLGYEQAFSLPVTISQELCSGMKNVHKCIIEVVKWARAEYKNGGNDTEK